MLKFVVRTLFLFSLPTAAIASEYSCTNKAGFLSLITLEMETYPWMKSTLTDRSGEFIESHAGVPIHSVYEDGLEVYLIPETGITLSFMTDETVISCRSGAYGLSCLNYNFYFTCEKLQ